MLILISIGLTATALHAFYRAIKFAIIEAKKEIEEEYKPSEYIRKYGHMYNYCNGSYSLKKEYKNKRRVIKND